MALVPARARCTACGGALMVEAVMEAGEIIDATLCLACGRDPEYPERPPTAEERHSAEHGGGGGHHDGPTPQRRPHGPQSDLHSGENMEG